MFYYNFYPLSKQAIFDDYSCSDIVVMTWFTSQALKRLKDVLKN